MYSIYDQTNNRKVLIYPKNTTVKPTALIQYLISLVTPIGGITVDLFFGSSTSRKSSIIDGDYKFIGIKKEKEYFNLAVERCQY
jgi:DNA modification methylase